MSSRNTFTHFVCRLLGTSLAGLAALTVCTSVTFAISDEPAVTDKVGSIEGESISVEGPMSVDVVGGKVRTVLRSGSDVRVKAGQARIELVEGGHITICGPAHFSVLKSGGSLTLALESGTIRAFVQNEPVLTVYTPQIQAKPISIGNGSMELLVGLDSAGSMCIRATKGAVRIEQQLTGQNMLVPQNGDVTLTNGQLETLQTSSGHCECEEQILASSEPCRSQSAGIGGRTQEKGRRKENHPGQPANSSTAEKAEPVYQVFMPPLHYDATNKTQDDFDPNLIILVRRVRVRPTLIFQGKVEGEPIVARNYGSGCPSQTCRGAKDRRFHLESHEKLHSQFVLVCRIHVGTRGKTHTRQARHLPFQMTKRVQATSPGGGTFPGPYIPS